MFFNREKLFSGFISTILITRQRSPAFNFIIKCRTQYFLIFKFDNKSNYVAIKHQGLFVE